MKPSVSSGRTGTVLSWCTFPITRSTPPLKHLKILWLNNSGISDRALETVGRFRGLEELHLSNTRVTDAGLAHLAALKDLKILSLANSGISDAALPHLKRFDKLEFLDVRGTRMAEQARRRLEDSLPKLQSR